MFAVQSGAVNDLKSQHQKPEGALIERAMAGPPKMSFRELARRIHMSDARIRQIVNGYASQGAQVLDVTGPADTVARLARALGVSAAEMRDAGRADAADIMGQTQWRPMSADGSALARYDVNHLVRPLREWLAKLDTERPAHPPIESLALWRWEDLFDAARAGVEQELERREWAIDNARRQASRLTSVTAEGGDGNVDADDHAGDPAPTKVGREQYELAADEQEIDPLDEAEETERST